MKEDMRKMFRDRPLRDNPPGPLRPDEALIELIMGGFIKRGSALDICCTNAINPIFLSQERWHVTVANINGNDLKDVRSVVDQSGVKMDMVDNISSPFPFPDGSFDLVYDLACFGSKPKSIIVGEVERVLRKGGKALFIVPNYRNGPGPACFTREMVDSMFHPPFEIERITDLYRDRIQKDGTQVTGYYYAVQLRKI